MDNCFYHLGRGLFCTVSGIKSLVTEYFGVTALYNLKEKLTKICLILYIRYLYVLSIHAIIFKCTWINTELHKKNCGYLIKFELSIFVIWSGPVDKVAVFQKKSLSNCGIQF